MTSRGRLAGIAFTSSGAARDSCGAVVGTDLRTLSSAESGALALSKEPTDILTLANDVASSLATRADEAGVTLGVETDAHADIEPIAIDPLRIREVLTNLVANALYAIGWPRGSETWYEWPQRPGPRG